MRLLSCVVLAGGIFLISHGAAAQAAAGEDADEEGAHFLLRQGLELVEHGDWSRAADRFRTALRMSPSPTIEYHLARSLFELGQLNEAEELVVAIRAQSDVPAELQAQVEELAQRIPSGGGTLTIRVDGPNDVEIFLDNRSLPPSRLQAPMTAAIGSHIVEARRDHGVLAREDVTVSRDTPAEAVLHIAVADDPLVGSGGESPAAPQEEGSLLSDWRFWAIAGGAAVVVAAVVIILAVTLSTSHVEDPIVGDFQPGVLTWQ